MNANHKRLLVINPNSSESVTENIQASVAPFQDVEGYRIDCVDLSGAPKGIDTQADVEAAIPLVNACIQKRQYDAYVLACFSDPGIRILRERCPNPIFGIGECAYLQAMSLGKKFGVISTVAQAVDRHRRYLSELGFEHRLAADLPLDLSAASLAFGEHVRERVLVVAEALVGKGADVLILGCAGMSRYQQDLREAFELPVIEPTVAAVIFAMNSSWFR